MKILVFSDTHLTHKFDQKKYQYLHSIIAQADRVIINGDFWDSWFTTFDKFVNSKWSQLFPLLKEKNTVYIFGNHDEKEDVDQRINLFCNDFGDEYIIRIGNQTVALTHGYNMLANRRGYIESKYRELLVKHDTLLLVIVLRHLMNFLERMGYKLNPNLLRKSSFAKKSNQLMKKNRLESNKDGWLIGADTHLSEIDHQQKYANSGSILYGYASYLLIEDGELNLIEERF